MSEPPRVARYRGTPLADRLIDAVLRYFYVELVGAHHVPAAGGALLVANHGPFGFDAVVLGALLARHARIPRWLADRNLWRTPGLGAALDFVGAIPGEPDGAVSLLERGELVVVYPGGVFDSFKPHAERHKLQWRKRAGFARVALRARVPIVPVAACGVDDIYRVVAREPGFGKWVFGDERYNFPIVLGRMLTLVPRRVKVTVEVLAPHAPVGSADDEASVLALRDSVERALQARLDRG